MSHSYAKVRPKTHRVYSVSEVMVLFNVCRNTVSNWVGSELRPSEEAGPQIFRGAELKRFQKERKSRNRFQLRNGEFKCLGCGSAVFPDPNSIVFEPTKNGAISGKSCCTDCNAHLFKFLGKTECDNINNARITNTSLASPHEGKGPDPAGIGKNSAQDPDKWHTHNDCILHKWLLYAGRYDDKTVDAHLAAIRHFENFFDGKPFEIIKVGDAASYRANMLELAKLPRAEGGLSKSMLQHRPCMPFPFIGSFQTNCSSAV